jgi:hypothetical protein
LFLLIFKNIANLFSSFLLAYPFDAQHALSPFIVSLDPINGFMQL